MSIREPNKLKLFDYSVTFSCSIIIPAYNAEKTISAVFSRIPLDTWNLIETVFVINDGSQDDTVNCVKDLRKKYQKIELFSFQENQGYGLAVSKGMDLCMETDSNYIVCLHADGQYPPEKIQQFISCMHEQQIDILQGSRHKTNTALEGGMPIYKYVAGKCLVYLENRVFNLKMTDYHSGFMFYSRNALRHISYHRLSHSFDFDLEMIAMAKCHGLTISELGIPTQYRGEKSYLNPFTYGLRVLLVLIKYLMGIYKPNVSSS